ncbi:hypothetical protein KEM52_004379 [Ascosphaera acerosa]|nr:hypothetical protein KEM52_004379 [Ascosphaera acerosa]
MPEATQRDQPTRPGLAVPISLKEQLWYYQLRREHVALAQTVTALTRKLDDFGDHLEQKLACATETLSLRARKLEETIDEKLQCAVTLSRKVDAIEQLVTRRPDMGSVLDTTLQPLKRDIEELQAQLANLNGNALSELQDRLSAAEQVMELLVQASEGGRELTQQLVLEMRSVKATADKARQDS